MTGHHEASSVLTFLVFLTGVSLLHLSSSNPVNTPGDIRDPQRIPPPGLTVSGDRERESLQKEETAAQEELFKDVDPQTLAAVLLEALNHSHCGGMREEDKHAQIDKNIMPKRSEEKQEEEYREVRTMEGADQGIDGQESSELLMATLGREQETEEERQRALEEEDKMTEKVTSHTTSQTVQVAADQQPPSPDGKEESGKSAPQQKQPISSEQGTNEEEEQLSPEELKSLETMMKEFPRLGTATKRKEESEQNQRESRGYSSHNNVIPINKGSNLAMSKKKLKWQEETQKALNLPVFMEGNFMDDFEDSNYGGDVALLQVPAEQEAMEEHGPEDEDEREEIEEEVLSPEEEEAQAKAEQEELRRQAAEAQRAKIEEEKLADIASDMLLRYMVKQNHGNKKYSSSLSSAAEDKRSDEDQGVTEDDDIDPQTIDKLIEISSKLHLPADDVVDIISDVEKKKKKDMPPELMSHWQPMMALPSSFSSTKGFSAPQVLTNQNNFPVSKQTSLPITLRKPWFLEKSPTKSHWNKHANPLLAKQNLMLKPQKPLSIKQDAWLKSPKTVWTGYSSYPYIYQSYYQQKPYPGYYPIYFPPPPRLRPLYYIPKPALPLNNMLGNSVDDTQNFPFKPEYHSWVKPRLRTPTSGLQQRPYYISYPLPLYPRTFQPVSVPKPRSPSQMRSASPPQKQMYFSGLVRDKDHYDSGKQSESRDLKKYIQQILLKRPRMLD